MGGICRSTLVVPLLVALVNVAERLVPRIGRVTPPGILIITCSTSIIVNELTTDGCYGEMACCQWFGGRNVSCDNERFHGRHSSR